MATFYKSEDEFNKEGTITKSGGTAPASTQAPASPTTQAPAAQPKGSGRFTNLQKYLDANQGGGDKLSSGIGKNIQSDIDKDKNKAQDYYSSIRSGIQQGQQTAQQGSQYLGQLQNINQNIKNQTGADKFGDRTGSLGINEFVNNPNFTDYQNMQAGRGINENALALNQQQLTQSAGGYLNTAQQAAQNLATESGRFNLLKNAFGGNVNPQYSVGQQRLDQLFLSNEGLNPLQQQVQQEMKTAQNLNRQAGKSDQEVGNLIRQEQQLIADYGLANKANEQAYVDMLGSYVDPLNEQRQQEWEDLDTALAAYRTGQGPGLSQQQLANLGVDSQMAAYNVLQNLQGAQDVASRGMDASSYQDVANAQDVERYNALARIMGMSDDQKRLTQESQLGNAYLAREGDANLKNRLTAADTEFQRLLDTTNVNRGINIGDNRWNVNANYENLLNQGQQGIGTTHQFNGNTTNYSGVAAPNPYSYLNQQQIWSDFENWLGNQGFDRTIGGDNTGQSLYGSRMTPYEMIQKGLVSVPGNEHIVKKG